jgi:hypothetical protein
MTPEVHIVQESTDWRVKLNTLADPLSTHDTMHGALMEATRIARALLMRVVVHGAPPYFEFYRPPAETE